ncbi:ATP-binding cassette domain-containing protein, partial [uncultured Desulfovibrio sp.]
MSELYKFSDVGKKFSGPGENLEIFKNINLIVEEGEALAIVGASGSGKSTLLHLMGALDTPSTGVVAFDGQDMALMSPDQKAAFRNKTL